MQSSRTYHVHNGHVQLPDRNSEDPTVTSLSVSRNVMYAKNADGLEIAYRKVAPQWIFLSQKMVSQELWVVCSPFIVI